jgi:transcriptional regulator
MKKSESMFNGRLTDKRLFWIFRNAGDRVYEIAIVLSIKKTGCYSRIMKKAEEFLHQRNNTLINGNDIKKMLGIESGRVIGEIKDRIFENQFRGNIRNYHDAREFIVRNFT